MLNTLNKHCYISFKVKDVLKIKFSPQNWTKWYPYILATFLGFAVADLVILSIRPYMLPTKVPPAKPSQRIALSNENRGTYNTIISRNIFNWDGIIPEPLQPKSGPKNNPKDENPVLSQLPLNLIGTIVHSRPEKSVATIELKGKNLIIAYRIKSDIENMATIFKIERGKVIFRNLNNNQLEFIESQIKNKLSFKGSRTPPKAMAPATNGEVIQTGSNQFQLKRTDLLKYTNNLASVLQQARSVPNRNPQTGEIDGFRLLDFQAGSIYEKLGLQKMDVIKGVNGEPVDSPAKAMELYNALKSSDKVNISVERNGKTESLDYSIQ
jgi:general secretion pathway protein C